MTVPPWAAGEFHPRFCAWLHCRFTFAAELPTLAPSFQEQLLETLRAANGPPTVQVASQLNRQVGLLDHVTAELSPGDVPAGVIVYSWAEYEGSAWRACLGYYPPSLRDEISPIVKCP